METNGSILILDDNKARKIARQLNLQFTGTIGIVIKAKLVGLIPSIKPILKKIKDTDFRIADELESTALSAAGEN
jgi:predicted nucleic acid-binding protein